MGKKSKRKKSSTGGNTKAKKANQANPAKQGGMRLPLVIGLIAILVIAIAWANRSSGPDFSQSSAPLYDFEVVRKIPHDEKAFTQGLLYLNGHFYESTGQRGASSLRRLDPNTGLILKQHDLRASYFGEGLAFAQGVLIQLTWTSGRALVYNSDTFELLREYEYDTPGWGLTYDGNSYIMSDGTDKIYFRDKSFKLERTLKVHDGGNAITNLNELEYINGEIWANVWETWSVVRISPETGEVVGRINFKGILDDDRTGEESAFNGIAYDPETDRLWVTGKYYKNIYEVKIHPKQKS